MSARPAGEYDGSRPRRILHLYKTYPPVKGGIEYLLRGLAEAQVAHGYEVTVLVTGDRQTQVGNQNGVRVIRAANLKTVASTPLSLALLSAVRHETPDITHLHLPYPVAELAWLIGGRQPMVASYHADVVRQRLLKVLWTPGQQRVLRSAKRIFVSNPVMMRTSEPLQPHRDRLVMVPYGIDVGPFRATARNRADFAHTSEETDGGSRAPADQATSPKRSRTPTLVFVGQLRYYKGLWVVLRALRMLDGVHLNVVGQGPEGPALKAEARELGVDNRVHWLGDVPDEDLPAALAAADVFVFPSVARSEAFGVVQVEAMATGLPVVSTELGTGTSWVNQDGATGLIVPPGDPEAFAAAIRRILADSALRARLGAGAQARALAEFTRERMARRIEATYQEVWGEA